MKCPPLSSSDLIIIIVIPNYGASQTTNEAETNQTRKIHNVALLKFAQFKPPHLTNFDAALMGFKYIFKKQLK